MMKRVAAVAAISLAAMQVLAGFTSVAMASHDGPGRHLGNKDNTVVPNGTESCTTAAGIAIIQDFSGVAKVWTDGTYLYCNVDNDTASDFSPAVKLADISSAIVYSNGDAAVVLEQTGADSGVAGTDRPANFGGLKLTIDSGGVLLFDAGSMDSYYGGTVVLTDTAFSGQGLVGTIFAADSGKYLGANGPDSFDASAVSADIYATGEEGGDTLKSGSGDDELYAGDGADKLYAGAGYDVADCSDTDLFNDQCWAGAGDDEVYLGTMSDKVAGTDVAAPGDGYDVVQGTTDYYSVIYVDSSVAVEFDGTAVYSEAGDDSFSASTSDGIGIYSFTGSPKGDLLYGFGRLNGGAGADIIIGTADDNDPNTAFAGKDVLSGGGGKDKIRSLSGNDTVYGDSGADTVRGGPGDDKVYGGGGDDVLYGLGGVDFLKGGTGIDQTWGGAGIDTCSGEVRDSCEFRKG